MAPAATIVQEGLQDFAKALEQAHLNAPWLGREMSHDPILHMMPFVWRWADIEPLITRTGELMTPGRGAEPRILSLDNPSVPRKTCTQSRTTAAQLLLQRECAPAQLH